MSKKEISTWEELSELQPSRTHRIEIEDDMFAGWIINLDTGKYDNYLSTHTFYKGSSEHYTDMLQRFGFNVVLIPLDY